MSAVTTTSASEADLRDVLVDSLPYIDSKYPELSETIDNLIKEEMEREKTSTESALPTEIELFSSKPMLAADLDRVSTSQSNPILDTARFRLEPPKNPKSLADWQTALENAEAQLEHQTNRLINLELVNTFGSNAWKLHCYQLEWLASSLQKEVDAAAKEVTDINKDRKTAQLKMGQTLQQLAQRYSNLVHQTLQVDVATKGLEIQVAALRAEREKLLSVLHSSLCMIFRSQSIACLLLRNCSQYPTRVMSSSSQTIRLNSKNIPLTAKAPTTIDLAKVEAFPPFKDWVSALDTELSRSPVANRVAVRGVEVTDVDEFGNGKIGFVKFKADVQWSDAEGGRIPGVVFARGGSVALLVIVRPEEATTRQTGNKGDKDERVVLVVQPRVAVASLAFAELPAGMLDGERKFSGTAAKELKEECGIEISEDELVDLTDLALGSDGGSGVYPSPGGSDEYIRLFLCRKRMPSAEIDRLEGAKGGLRGEGERIDLRLVKKRDLWKLTRDMKALSALTLYEKCAEAGLLPDA
ncbi:hypothetical protein HDU90_002034 [Geranomyces variabilis]|nr:hypothetical protein HDU90_002034 [Geranomyces variabilis]